MKTKRQHPRWTTTKKTRKRVSKTTMREKPVIKEFKELLLTHPVERMYMERMITSIPKLTPAQRKANPPPKDRLLYTSPSPRDDELSRMPSSA